MSVHTDKLLQNILEELRIITHILTDSAEKRAKIADIRARVDKFEEMLNEGYSPGGASAK